MGYIFAFKYLFLKNFMNSGKLLNLHKTVAEVDSV
jgi:hypothetical protein